MSVDYSHTTTDTDSSAVFSSFGPGDASSIVRALKALKDAKSLSSKCAKNPTAYSTTERRACTTSNARVTDTHIKKLPRAQNQNDRQAR